MNFYCPATLAGARHIQLSPAKLGAMNPKQNDFKIGFVLYKLDKKLLLSSQLIDYDEVLAKF